MTTIPLDSHLRFDELDSLDAPNWDSFWRGAIGGVSLIGIYVAIVT